MMMNFPSEIFKNKGYRDLNYQDLKILDFEVKNWFCV